MQDVGGVSRFKKYNPNPRPEPQLPEIEPFPEYDTWKSMMEAGTLPSEFDVQPDYDIPTPGATTPGGFEFGTPERIGRAEEFYEVPGAMPTEIGMPIEEGAEGMPPGFSIEDIMGMITGGELSTAEINLMRDLGLTGLPGMEEPIGEEKPMIFPETREEFIDQKIQEGMKSSEIKGLSDLLYPEEEEAKLTSIDVMRLGQEQGFTTKEEYVNALMGELGMDYEKALNFYLTYTAEHPEYPKE